MPPEIPANAPPPSLKASEGATAAAAPTFAPETLAKLTAQTGLGTPELLHSANFTHTRVDGTVATQSGTVADMLLSKACPVGGAVRRAYSRGGLEAVEKKLEVLSKMDQPTTETERFHVPISSETRMREDSKVEAAKEGKTEVASPTPEKTDTIVPSESIDVRPVATETPVVERSTIMSAEAPIVEQVAKQEEAAVVMPSGEPVMTAAPESVVEVSVHTSSRQAEQASVTSTVEPASVVSAPQAEVVTAQPAPPTAAEAIVIPEPVSAPVIDSPKPKIVPPRVDVAPAAPVTRPAPEASAQAVATNRKKVPSAPPAPVLPERHATVPASNATETKVSGVAVDTKTPVERVSEPPALPVRKTHEMVAPVAAAAKPAVEKVSPPLDQAHAGQEASKPVRRKTKDTSLAATAAVADPLVAYRPDRISPKPEKTKKSDADARPRRRDRSRGEREVEPRRRRADAIRPGRPEVTRPASVRVTEKSVPADAVLPTHVVVGRRARDHGRPADVQPTERTAVHDTTPVRARGEVVLRGRDRPAAVAVAAVVVRRGRDALAPPAPDKPKTPDASAQRSGERQPARQDRPNTVRSRDRRAGADALPVTDVVKPPAGRVSEGRRPRVVDAPRQPDQARRRPGEAARRVVVDHAFITRRQLRRPDSTPVVMPDAPKIPPGKPEGSIAPRPRPEAVQQRTTGRVEASTLSRPRQVEGRGTRSAGVVVELFAGPKRETPKPRVDASPARSAVARLVSEQQRVVVAKDKKKGIDAKQKNKKDAPPLVKAAVRKNAPEVVSEMISIPTERTRTRRKRKRAGRPQAEQRPPVRKDLIAPPKDRVVRKRAQPERAGQGVKSVASEVIVKRPVKEKRRHMRVRHSKDGHILTVRRTTEPLVTVTELKKVLERAGERRKRPTVETTRTRPEKPRKQKPIVVSEAIMDFVAKVTKDSEKKVKKKTKQKKKELGITLTTQGEHVRQIHIDRRQLKLVREMLRAVDPEVKKVDAKEKTIVPKQDRVAKKLEKLIEHIENQVQTKKEAPLVFISKDLMQFLLREKKTIARLEKIKRLMKRNRKKEKTPEVSVSLFSGDRELQIELELLKKLLLLKKMKETLGAEEGAAEEIKRRFAPTRADDAFTKANYFTMLLLLSVLDQQLPDSEVNQKMMV
jgi:hypothetical protein